MGSSADEIFADLKRQGEQQISRGEYDAALDDFMEHQVVPVWKDNSPVDTGGYRESVKVTQRAHGGRGQVGATSDIANLVEYGSIHNQEHAPRAKTEAHFDRGPSAGALGESDVL